MSLLPEVVDLRTIAWRIFWWTRRRERWWRTTRTRTEKSSVLVFFDIDAGKVRRQVKLPVRVRAPFIAPPGTVSIVLREAPPGAVGSLDGGRDASRQGRLGSGILMNVIPWRGQRFVNVLSHRRP